MLTTLSPQLLLNMEKRRKKNDKAMPSLPEQHQRHFPLLDGSALHYMILHDNRKWMMGRGPPHLSSTSVALPCLLLDGRAVHVLQAENELVQPGSAWLWMGLRFYI